MHLRRLLKTVFRLCAETPFHLADFRYNLDDLKNVQGCTRDNLRHREEPPSRGRAYCSLRHAASTLLSRASNALKGPNAKQGEFTLSLVSEYLHAMRLIRATGAGTAETSYYLPLNDFLNEIGRTLKPRVSCVLQLQNRGAGMPDGGCSHRIRCSGTESREGSQVPSRGIIEVKSPEADLDALADSEQVRRYLAMYGQVLVTNYRSFRLLMRNADGSARTVESYALADSSAAFWTGIVTAIDNEHGELFPDFLKRVLLYAAPLTDPRTLPGFSPPMPVKRASA